MCRNHPNISLSPQNTIPDSVEASADPTNPTDSDTDGTPDYLSTDSDGDGFASAISGGNDCDDADAAINPDATEIAWNDIDEDCSGKDLHNYLQISAGNNYVCGVASTGDIVCWGRPFTDYGQTDTLEGDFRQVVASYDSNCTVSQDNVLSCYGDIPASNQTNPPGGPGFLTVSMAPNETPICAITTNGDIVCGHCNTGDPSVCDPPSGTYTQLDSAQNLSCALTTAGAIACWGSENTSGSFHTEVPTENGFTAVELAGASNACALDENGARMKPQHALADALPAIDSGTSSHGRTKKAGTPRDAGLFDAAAPDGLTSWPGHRAGVVSPSRARPLS